MLIERVHERLPRCGKDAWTALPAVEATHQESPMLATLHLGSTSPGTIITITVTGVASACEVHASRYQPRPCSVTCSRSPAAGIPYMFKYLPAKEVAYPACFRYVANPLTSVFVCHAGEEQLPAMELPTTMLLCWYCPLTNADRDGQHTGVDAYMWLKVYPASAMRDCSFGM